MSTLNECTLQLLQNRSVKVTFQQLSTETQIPVGWIKAYAQGRIKNPSVVRVELLYTALTGQSLEF